MGTSTKDIVCALTDIEHDVIARAAADSGTAIGDFLVAAGFQRAQALGSSLPYRFAGRLFATQNLPDSWYDATSESELIGHLKTVLRRRDVDAARAMAVELLDFPAGWSELEAIERRYASNEDVANGDSPDVADPELAVLVNATIAGSIDGCEALLPTARNWDCYKAILKGGVKQRGGSHETSRLLPTG